MGSEQRLLVFCRKYLRKTSNFGRVSSSMEHYTFVNLSQPIPVGTKRCDCMEDRGYCKQT